MRKGSLLREGRLRLAGWRAPEGGFRDMARFLLTGESSGSVITEAVVAEGKGKPAADLNVKAAAAFKQPPPSVVSRGTTHAPGYGKKWTALGTGVAAVGLGVFGLVQTSAGKDNIAKAKAMLEPGGALKDGYTEAEYNKVRDEGNRQRTIGTASLIGAGVALGTSAVFGYLGFRDSGTFGRIEF